ncbi:MAG: hypothetical protein RLZZ519_2478 [Bacteroidota bacterium]
MLLVAAFGMAKAQIKLVDDLPLDPRVRIVDPRLHHEVYGTGFVAELDLSGLPAWTGDLEISAVEWPVAKETLRERFSDVGDRGRRNPFVAFTVALARIGSMAGNSKREIEPLIPETVFALSEGVVDSGNGKMVIPTLPENKRIRFFIPHAMVQDSDRVYFMLNAAQFKVPVKYLYTEQLFPDTLLPDLKVAFVRSEATRYQGAAGKMITLSYQFPEYLLKFTREYHGMTPELTLNGKYPIPKPGSSPISWNFVKKSTGKLYFFIPDALYDEAGKAYVDISFKEEERSPRIGYQRVELEGEPIVGSKVGFRVLDLEQKKPSWSDGFYTSSQIQLGIGGITVWESGVASRSLGDKKHLRWADCPEVWFTPCQSDSISARVKHESQEHFGHAKCVFFCSTLPSPKGKRIYEIEEKFSDEYFKYHWILRIMYIL